MKPRPQATYLNSTHNKPMKIQTAILPLAAILALPLISHAENKVPPANNIEYPTGLTNWRVISTSIRNDNNTQRAILGNSIAIRAARSNTAKLTGHKVPFWQSLFGK